jgi:hypothetical protein
VLLMLLMLLVLVLVLVVAAIVAVAIVRMEVVAGTGHLEKAGQQKQQQPPK